MYINTHTVVYDICFFLFFCRPVILMEMIIMGLLNMVSFMHHLSVGVDVPIN